VNVVKFAICILCTLGPVAVGMGLLVPHLGLPVWLGHVICFTAGWFATKFGCHIYLSWH
jgi:hypothetical protein